MDEMLEIADDSSRDYVEKTGAIKARKWTLARLARRSTVTADPLNT